MTLDIVVDSGTLNLVRVGNTMTQSSLKEVAEHIQEAFMGLVTDVRTCTHDSPMLEEIDAVFLTMILHEQYQGHVLGITDALLKKSDEDDEFYNTIIGGKNETNDVAVISTKLLTPGKDMSERGYRLYIDRVAKVALHEIGHNYNLWDHDEFRKGSGDRLCPMSRGIMNMMDHQAYVTGVIDRRGELFCEECTDRLKKIINYRKESGMLRQGP